MSRSSLLLALPLLLAACPDPAQNKDKAGPMPGGMPPEVGMPAGTPPGAGGEMGPGAAPGGAPAGMRPNARFDVEAGQGVKISGTLTYAGSATGTLRLDVLRTGTSQFPELVHTAVIDKPGPFEIEAPKAYGDVRIMSFIDTSDNGPSPGEPAGGWEPVITIGSEPVTGIDIVLADRPDLKDLAPPGPEKMGAPGSAPAPGQTGGPAVTPTPAGEAAPPADPAAGAK